jgi:signal transduction histidine kinase/ligand-binding sensor domain-containing protein
MRNHGICWSLILWSLLWSVDGIAERLPVRQYTVADGLAQGTVWDIHQDARGFLWLATSDGVSRFDGYRFTNYKKSEGLNYFRVYDVTADQRGRLWLATGEGVSLLLDATEAARQGKKFNQFLLSAENKPEGINETLRVLFDAENRMWVLTYTALFRAQSTEVVTGQFERLAEFGVANTPPQILQDRRGRIWAAVNQQLRCIEGDNVISYELWQAGETKGLPELRWIKGMVELSDGRILIATNKDLYEFIEPAVAGQRGSWRRLPFSLPPQNVIAIIHPAADGGLWVGTDAGLIRYRDGWQVSYRISNDSNSFNILAFHSDRDGNLWVGTQQRGLLKLKGEAISVYDASDGLVPVMEVYYLRGETLDGRMILHGRPVSPLACNETFLTNNNTASPNALTRLQPPPSLCVHDVLQDSRKNWWVLRWLNDRKTYKLRFYPGPTLDLSAGYELTAADGWVDGAYTTLYEDRAGTLWLRRGSQIFRVEFTSSGRPRVVEIVKEGMTGHAIHFSRDPSGALWWTEGATVWRHQQGKIDAIALPVQKPRPRSFFADRKGRLWISTIEHGVLMTDAPNSDQPRFVNYTVADGLAHNQVEVIREDADGNLWFGTVRGLCRLDELTGRFSLVSFGESSLGTAVRDLHADSRGHLWASLMGAVIRLNPRLLQRPVMPPPVYFNHVSIAGEPLALGETGAVNLAPLELAAERNNLEIEFVSPNFRDENTVRYQYKLDGVDADWSAPNNVREVNYARLAAGNFTFLVRAVNESGTVTAEAARLPFVILRPLWQRWWFVSLSALLLGGLIYGAYRYRVAQIVALERVRTRIASDLHDDVGANLSLIAGISEMLEQQAEQTAPQLTPQLAVVANASRRSMDAMSDIVWMINPNKDHLHDLTQRIRRFASDTLAPRNIAVTFALPDEAADMPITSESRREIFLLCKEAINNLARHSACTAAEITLTLDGTLMTLRVCDNGKGFVMNGGNGNGNGGQGLLSMRSRAEKLGGQLTITTPPDGGTEIVLRASLGA